MWPSDLTDWTISSVNSGHLRSVFCGQPTSVLTPRRRTCRQRLEASTASRFEPAVNRAAMKPIAGDHRARTLALAHTRHGHRADGLQRAMIQCPSISRHDGMEYDRIRICCLTY